MNFRQNDPLVHENVSEVTVLLHIGTDNIEILNSVDILKPSDFASPMTLPLALNVEPSPTKQAPSCITQSVS